MKKDTFPCEKSGECLFSYRMYKIIRSTHKQNLYCLMYRAYCEDVAKEMRIFFTWRKVKVINIFNGDTGKLYTAVGL